MAIDSRKYREILHQIRNHPDKPLSEEESKTPRHWYWTAPVFLIVEGFLEMSVDGLPAGISFPFGFLVFGGFYYTYRNPGYRKKSKEIPLPPTSPPNTSHAFYQTEALPKEIESALSLLGLKGCRDWSLIQKRYRELAKRFHPDLNPDITVSGNRFIIYDGAYRRLSLVKEKYFRSSRKS